MTVKIAVIGAAGRMGTEILRACSKRDDITVASAVEHKNSSALGCDFGELAQIKTNGVKITAELDKAVASADVIVDLSLPDATPAVLTTALKNCKPLICGTTGLSDKIIKRLNDAGDSIPVIYTPNLSPAIAVVKDLIRRATAALAPDYDVEVVEMHHRNKADAPSGTAYFLAEAAAAGAGVTPNEAFSYGRHGKTGIRPRGEIGIHSIRGGGVFGDHTVIISGLNERIEITHKAESRALFAEGALRAALFLADKKPGNYSMADVLGL